MTTATVTAEAVSERLGVGTRRAFWPILTPAAFAAIAVILAIAASLL